MDFRLTKILSGRESEMLRPPHPPPSSDPATHYSMSNGTLKRHRHNRNSPPPEHGFDLIYKECLKNHAASMGGHTLDGCGEFMPSPISTVTDPTSLKCAACGCHRNFHRRKPDELNANFHYLQPLRSSASLISPPSPPPLEPHPSPYYSSTPHMLIALRPGLSGPFDDYHHLPNGNPTVLAKSDSTGNGRKRIRTKFSQEQKEKMYSFSEKLGWKMCKSDEGLIEGICNEIGIGKSVLKIWMHNNKSTLGKIREVINHSNNNQNHAINGDKIGNGVNGDNTTNISFDTINGGQNHQNEVGSANFHVSANGSSQSAPS